MHLLTFIANLAFCSLFLGLCNGAPVGESKTRRTSRYYSQEEDLFIINEMRSYPGEFLPIWGLEMWNDIANNHAKLRELNSSIFPPRTALALKNHFQTVILSSKGEVALPEDIVRRLPKPQKKNRASDEGPSHPSENERQTGIPGTAVKQGDRQDDIKTARNRYTYGENRFIINFLKNHPEARGWTLSKKVWTEAARQHRELQKTNPSEFPYERTAEALKLHFRRMAEAIVKRKQKKTMDADKDRLRYTEAENDFIFEELLKPTCTSLYSAAAWEKIKAQHDRKVQSNTPGFDQYRSPQAMKNHCVKYLLAPKNKVPQAIKDKFARNFSKTQGESSNAQDGRNEDSSFWAIFDESFAELEDQFQWEGGEEELEGQDDSGKWDVMIAELLSVPGEVAFRPSKDQ